MQRLIFSDSPRHFLIPLPPGVHEDSPELFGFFTNELRVGHANFSGWKLETSELLAEFDANGVVAWGSWASGTLTRWGGSSTSAAMLAANYIAGDQSPSLGVLRPSYTAFASTAPIAISGSTVAACVFRTPPITDSRVARSPIPEGSIT